MRSLQELDCTYHLKNCEFSVNGGGATSSIPCPPGRWGLLGSAQQAINHALRLGAVAAAKQVEMVNDVIQVIENFAGFVPGR